MKIDRKKKKKKFILFTISSSIILILLAVLKLIYKVSKFKKKTNSNTVFKGKDIDYTDMLFEKASHSALFSGLEIDLTNAIPSDDVMQLSLYGEYSGITIRVPLHWNIFADGINVKGSITNQTLFDSNDTDSPRLDINYDLRYSGLIIKYGKHHQSPSL
jgi:hypothetical protein